MTISERLAIKYYGSIKLGGINIWITQSDINMWAIMAALIIFAAVVRLKLKNFSDKPAGFQNAVEALVEMFDNLLTGVMGREYAYFSNWFFGLMAFILIANISGIIGLREPTADISMTLTFGLSSFALFHIMGVWKGRRHYFREYVTPSFIMLPIHIMGELAKPISLSFRMFGAITGGYILMELVYALFPAYLKIAIPAALGGFFNIALGALQAYIFLMLSLTFIRNNIPEEH